MGIFDRLRRAEGADESRRPSAALKITPGAFDPVDGAFSAMPFIATPSGQGRAARAAFAQAQSASYAAIYRTQPAVRKVVDYIARNGAQIGIKLYERVSDDDREERYEHPAAQSIRIPNTRTPGRRFLYGLLADYLIYENAYAVKFRPRNSERISFLRVPVWAVEVEQPSGYDPVGYRLHLRNGEQKELDPADVVHLCGYDPDNPGSGVSRLETLRQILAEEIVNQTANVERLKKGGLGPGYIKRPLEAPEWKNEIRSAFESDWANRTRDGSDARVLEEGMEFVESSVTPKDAEMLAGRTFTRAEVASLYGLPAVLVEAAEKGSDVGEARTRFYADCLPPLLTPITDDLNLQVLIEEYGLEDHYYEFNLGEKLRGQEAERYKVLVSAAGAPILTRNEARRRENLPDVDGGDELITPLNVVVGDKPSTGAMGPQDPNGPSQDGDHRQDEEPEARRLEAIAEQRRAEQQLVARREGQRRRRDRYAEEHRALLRKTFERQERAYKSSGKFDQARWDAELAEDLEAKARSVVEREGGIAAERLALGEFDLERCSEYLHRGAEERAHAINTTTANALAAAKESTDAKAAGDEEPDPFETAKGERAEQGGLAMATSLSAFAHTEAARQTPDASSRVKTWIVTAGNSRHPELNGETVPLDGVFSNGGEHPGDPSLGAAETARCQCLIEVA